MKHEGGGALHRKLDVWNAAIEVATLTYGLTRQFPDEEKFGLTSQMRRAAVSIGSNIAEGAARQTTKEYVQFLYIASGSTSELDTQLVIVENIGFIDSANAAEVRARLKAISQMTHGLIRRLKNNCKS